MKFCVINRFELSKEENTALLLAKQTGQAFPELTGLEAWQSSINQIAEYFHRHKIDKKGKQHDYSALASNADNTAALQLHLSNIHLAAKSRELGSESAALLQWGKSLASIIAQQKWQHVFLPLVLGIGFEQLRLVLEGLWFGSYQFTQLKKQREKEVEPCINIIASDQEAHEIKALLQDMDKQIAAMKQTLKLVLSPANICTPEFFSDFATKQVQPLDNVKAEIWGEDKLKAEGMELLLAVGQGSPQESRLLILDYQGAPASSQHIALVGKGVCFDTGGTNLKSSANIRGMQYDMMGAGIVYGTFFYLASSCIKGNIKAYIPLVENQIGGHAIKTGDIIKSAMGLTVEINNTDAEGRLILADTIHYAVQQKPKLLLDCATLTGASIVALGEQCASFYSNDDQAAELFAKASCETAEDTWRMPLFRPYANYLESKLADLSNISTKSSHAGSLTAALFLERFVLQEKELKGCDRNAENSPTWLHLDLAGWSSLDEHPSLGKNSRCMGLRLLSHFVKSYLEK